MKQDTSMFEPFLPYDKFKAMKVIQYQDIMVSKDMACPNCNGSSQFSYDNTQVEPIPIGWCDTLHGFMAVFECPKCYTRYRFHINTTGRYDLDTFYADFALLVHLYEAHQQKEKTT